jgi:hypothetical protein
VVSYVRCIGVEEGRVILILNGNEEETWIDDDEVKGTDNAKEVLPLAISSNDARLSGNHSPFDCSLEEEVVVGEAFHSGRSFSIFVPGSIPHF